MTTTETKRPKKKPFAERIDELVPFFTLAVLLAAVAVTWISDVPSSLPGIALGSEPLFYLERGLVVMAAGVVLLMLVVRGLKRELPSEASTSGLGYSDPVKEAVSTSQAAVDLLAKRVDKLEDTDKAHLQALMLLQQMVERVDKEIDVWQESIRQRGTLSDNE